MTQTNGNMDFLEVLLDDLLNKQGYYAHVVSPMTGNGNSIAVMVMPNNDYTHYYDGSYRQGFAFQVITKHKEQMMAYHTANEISKLLQNVPNIPSRNNSYIYEGIKITTATNGMGQSEGYSFFGTQFSADLYVKK